MKDRRGNLSYVDRRLRASGQVSAPGEHETKYSEEKIELTDPQEEKEAVPDGGLRTNIREGPHFLTGDAVDQMSIDNSNQKSSGAERGTDVEQYDLPWRLEFAEEETVGASSLERALGEFEADESYDLSASGRVRTVGDGKNIYKLRRQEGFEDLPDIVADVNVQCIGVCDPETYQDIVAVEGFDGVLEYVDGSHSDAVGYDPENEEFLYPDQDLRTNASDSTVDDALDNYEPVISD